MTVDRKLGFILLSVWLIAMGAQQVFSLHFQYDHVLIGGLAIAAGVVLLIKR